jgi:hypothetical protein
MGLVDLDAVADELYGLSLEDFIPTRTAREREMKAADNKELAAEIHRLPKPNVVAWLVNQLVREHYDDIQALLGLGSAMREATATFSGDRLRELSREQHEAIRRLVEHAKLLAHVAGRQVSDDTVNSLEETLRAAMADPGKPREHRQPTATVGRRKVPVGSQEAAPNERATRSGTP